MIRKASKYVIAAFETSYSSLCTKEVLCNLGPIQFTAHYPYTSFPDSAPGPFPFAIQMVDECGMHSRKAIPVSEGKGKIYQNNFKKYMYKVRNIYIS
jgi:hypothetical protein